MNSESSRIIQLITERGEPLAFKPHPLPSEIEEEFTLPEGIGYWRNPFAIILLYPVYESTIELVELAADEGITLMSALLRDLRAQDLNSDGYLLIALMSGYTVGITGVIRDIEQNTRICREHVIWPDPHGDWSWSVDGVTILALPPSPSTTKSVKLPKLEGDAGRILELSISKSSAKVITELENRLKKKLKSNAD